MEPNTEKHGSDFVTLQCPSCGGDLEPTRDADKFLCASCGLQHLLKGKGPGIAVPRTKRTAGEESQNREVEPADDRGEQLEKKIAEIEGRKEAFIGGHESRNLLGLFVPLAIFSFFALLFTFSFLVAPYIGNGAVMDFPWFGLLLTVLCFISMLLFGTISAIFDAKPLNEPKYKALEEKLQETKKQLEHYREEQFRDFLDS
jgi:hypothetical protein